MRAFLSLTFIAVPLTMLAAPPPSDVSRLAVSGPQTTRRISASQVTGTPTRLCPSPDGTQVYLRTSERDRWTNETLHHKVFTIHGSGVTPLDGEPTWAARYWLWKSAAASQEQPAFQIRLETREENVRTANVPREGNIGMNTTDPNATLDEVVRNAALASQKAYYETYWLGGKAIGTAVNERLVPGRTFGWAPAPMTLIAFVNEKGRLVLMDGAGRTREVKGTKDVLLPAWTADGRTILFLQKAGRKGFDLRLVQVQPR